MFSFIFLLYDEKKGLKSGLFVRVLKNLIKLATEIIINKQSQYIPVHLT